MIKYKSYKGTFEWPFIDDSAVSSQTRQVCPLAIANSNDRESKRLSYLLSLTVDRVVLSLPSSLSMIQANEGVC